MNLHLNKDLNEIYKELLKFNPTSSILTRKTIETNSIFNIPNINKHFRAIFC